MEKIILERIAFDPDMAALMNRLHIEPGSSAADEVEDFMEQVRSIARPRALYGLAYVTDKQDEEVTIEGITFHSRVLRVNLEACYHVFPYIATCGPEFDAWFKAQRQDDLLLTYWLDVIKEMALRQAIRALMDDLEARFAPGETSAMNPGSLADWPLPQQRPLFRLLGDPEADIGVRLTDSCLMEPNKSVSGIRFATEESFASCQLCPREVCPGRRAPYEAVLYESRYAR
ncbi:MAG: vitamin B12 dependent methionine synthase [Anaerolineae bacterium]|nr:vitamin B12 dependent methionine synthase [Anaerolineae bacterium]